MENHRTSASITGSRTRWIAMIQGFCHDHRGGGMLESALVLSVLVLLLMGIFDLGRAVYLYTDVSQAAREGARFGSAHTGDIPGTQAAAVAMSVTGLSTGDVTVEFPDATPATVRVTVRRHFQAVTPLISSLAGGAAGITLLSTSSMVLE